MSKTIFSVGFVLVFLVGLSFAQADLDSTTTVISDPSLIMDDTEKEIAHRKYQSWDEIFRLGKAQKSCRDSGVNIPEEYIAYTRYKIEQLFSDSSNFVFNEKELNYIVQQKLSEKAGNPSAESVKVFLRDGLIKASGTLLSPFRASVVVMIKSTIDDSTHDARLKVVSMKIKRKSFFSKFLPVPRPIVNNLANRDLKKILAFMREYGYQMKIVITPSAIRLLGHKIEPTISTTASFKNKR